MGQLVIGIMLGVRPPEGVELRDEESDAPAGLLDRWEDTCRGAIDRLQAKLNADPQHGGECTAAERYVPDVVWDEDALGFWVAVGVEGRTGLDGYPSLPRTSAPARIVKEDETYAPAYKAARRRWARFARWARGLGVELGKPRLMRVETEVA